MQINHFKKISLLLLSGFVLFISFNTVLAIEHQQEDCTHADCAICYHLQQTQKLLQGFLGFPAKSIISLGYYGFVLALGQTLFFAAISNLVLLKVRMDN